MSESKAYVDGWNAVMAGADPRYANPFPKEAAAQRYAWNHGALDAMEAEDGEEPEPACAGYES